MDDFIKNMAKQFGAEMIGGNCEAYAKETDWNEKEKRCDFKNDSGSCVIKRNHTGTPHRICRYSENHLGSCSYSCFWNSNIGDCQ